MSKWFGFFIALFLLSSISAICEDGQIDINSASLEELDEIIHVGSKTAQRIIDLRPFSSLEDLDGVPYISPNYVEDIKSQGLACVDGEESDYDEGEILPEIQEPADNIPIAKDNSPKTLEKITLGSPNAETKNIKSNNGENKSTGSYATYGLIAFCILLGVLFLRKKRQVSEFDK